MALSKLFGKNPELEKLPDEIRELLLQMRNERNALERLATRVEESLKQAQGLTEPIGRAHGQLRELEGRLATAEKITSRFDQLQQGIEHLGRQWRESEGRLRLTTNRIAQAQTELKELKPMLLEAMTLKEELRNLPELAQPLAQLRKQAAGLEAQFGDLRERFGAVLREHKQLQGVGNAAVAKMQAIDEDWQRVRSEMSQAATRVAMFEQKAQQLEELVNALPDAAQELENLRALSAHVAEGSAAVTEQRDMVARALANAEQLASLAETIDTQLGEHRSTTQWIAQVQDRIEHLRKMHEDLLHQIEQVVRQQSELQEGGREQYDRFEQLAAAIDGTGKRLAQERRDLEALGQQVADMQAIAAELKQRLPEVHETRTAVVAIGSDAEQLGARLSAIAKEMEQVQADAEAVDTLRGDLRRMWATAQDLDRRLREIVQPAAETAERAEVRMTDVRGQLDALERRAASLDDVGRKLERLEHGLAQGSQVEDRLRETLDAARERQQQLESVLYDFERLSSAPNETIAQARAVAELRREVEQRHQGLAALVQGLEDLTQRAAALDRRAKLLDAAEKQASRLEATSDDVQALMRTVLEQKAFLQDVLDAVNKASRDD